MASKGATGLVVNPKRGAVTLRTKFIDFIDASVDRSVAYSLQFRGIQMGDNYQMRPPGESRVYEVTHLRSSAYRNHERVQPLCFYWKNPKILSNDEVGRI